MCESWFRLLAAYSCVQFVKMASTPSQAIAVPLRPELFEFIGVQGLGRLACCSAALREELRDAKAWQLLASAREPRSQHEIAIDAERAAAARVRAYDSAGDSRTWRREK